MKGAKTKKRSPRFDWTPQRVKQAAAMKQSGKTYREVGGFFGVSLFCVQKVLRQEVKSQKPADGLCSKCGVASVSLNFHHTNYETADGLFLCASCHYKEHFGSTEPKPKPDLPAELREQLAKAGKKSWKARLKRARQAAKEKETAK